MPRSVCLPVRYLVQGFQRLGAIAVDLQVAKHAGQIKDPAVVAVVELRNLSGHFLERNGCFFAVVVGSKQQPPVVGAGVEVAAFAHIVDWCILLRAVGSGEDFIQSVQVLLARLLPGDDKEVVANELFAFKLPARPGIVGCASPFYSNVCHS